ncbi:MAG: hypothetical protein PHD76_09935 [Methylacidiphilales bacterium]|nr:hypothetical protein [Candidatus Methylacidiphilales bacterium]
MSTTSSCLVLGAAAGLKPEGLDVFINSLRNTGYADSTAIVVYDSDRELATWLKSRGVFVVAVPAPARPDNSFPSPKRISQAGRNLPGFLRRRLIDPLAAARLHIRFSRYLYFNRFLRRHRDEFTHVFLADTRDIVFQADPFPALQSCDGALCLFAEDPIREQDFNTRCVLEFYGAGSLKSIGQQPGFCSGTTGGGTRAVLAYLDCMAREIICKLKILHKYDYGDQAVHIWTAWAGRLPKYRVLENFNGPVANLGIADAGRFRWNSQGLMLNDDGSIIPVLHQYNRHPCLESLVEKLAA